jgi:hypothetical protein
MKTAIVGHGSNKFNKKTEKAAKDLIKSILSDPKNTNVIAISGHSPMGGIDIWTEEAAKELGIKMEIKAPKQQTWDAEYGYKQRNLDIARTCDEIHVILVTEYPETYKGKKFNECYHCAKHPEGKEIAKHVKSGGCWTGWEAFKLGKECFWHIVK